MYLVDANVLSTGSPGRRDGTGSLADWLDARSGDLFMSAVTVAEVGDGIAKLRRSGSLARADRLDDWLHIVLHLYGDRAMAFDTPAARLAGLTMDRARAAGHAPGIVGSRSRRLRGQGPRARDGTGRSRARPQAENDMVAPSARPSVHGRRPARVPG